MKVQGEATSADIEAVASYSEDLAQTINKSGLHQPPNFQCRLNSLTLAEAI